MSAAGGPFHSIRHQQSPLRNAKRNHGREEKRNRRGHTRLPRLENRANAKSRKDLRPGENEENRIFVWFAKRSGREACRKIEVRSASDLTQRTDLVARFRCHSETNRQGSLENLGATANPAGPLQNARSEEHT